MANIFKLKRRMLVNTNLFMLGVRTVAEQAAVLSRKRPKPLTAHLQTTHIPKFTKELFFTTAQIYCVGISAFRNKLSNIISMLVTSIFFTITPKTDLNTTLYKLVKPILFLHTILPKRDKKSVTFTLLVAKVESIL